MNKYLKVFAVATMLSMVMPLAALAEDGQNSLSGNQSPAPRRVMPKNEQGQGEQENSMMPGGDEQKKQMRFPKNLSDGCKADLQSAMDSHDQEQDAKTSANKKAIADLMKAKRKALRAQEDSFISARRALEDTLDNAMAAAGGSTDEKTAQQTFKKAMGNLTKDNNKKVKQIEQDFQKQMKDLTQTTAVTKPELPDSCKDEMNNLGSVKGAFIVNKKK